MSRQPDNLLDKLEPVGLNRYQITAKDLQTIERYLKIIQQDLGASTWEELLNYTGPYGTSIAIHEIVEIRQLRARGVDPLAYNTRRLRLLLAQHSEAHIIALYEEHLYLQEVINRLYKQKFEVATLMKANCTERDVQLFLESNVGIYLLEEERVTEAQQAISRLKGETQ